MNCIWAASLALSIGMISSQAWGQSNDGTRVVDYPIDGIDLGAGWNSVFYGPAVGAGYCIEFVRGDDKAQDQTMRFARVVDKDSLMRALTVSLDFQAKAALGQSGSGKAEFSRTVELRNENLNLVVLATVIKGATFVKAPEGKVIRLKDEYVAKLKAGFIEEFLKECGDSYVSAIRSGAQLSAVLAFRISSREEQENIRGSLSGSFATFSSSGSASRTLKKYEEQQQLTIDYHLAGGSGIPLPIKEEGLLQRIEGLPAAAKEAPQHWNVVLRPYDLLGNWPIGKLEIEQGTLFEAVQQYQRLHPIFQDLYRILYRPQDYVLGYGASVESLADMQDELGRRIDRIKGAIQKCISAERSECKLADEDKILDYDYRYRVPLSRSTFTHDRKLEIEKEKAAKVRQIFSAPGGGSTAWWEKMRKELQDSEDTIRRIQDSYLADLRQAVFEQWVQVPNELRCKYGQSDVCLSNVRLSEYRKKISEYVLPPKVTGVVGIPPPQGLTGRIQDFVTITPRQ